MSLLFKLWTITLIYRFPLILPSQISIDEIKPYIIGGRNATLGEIPCQVGIKSSNMFCGGSIIYEQWILTAAHCIFKFVDK